MLDIRNVLFWNGNVDYKLSFPSDYGLKFTSFIYGTFSGSDDPTFHNTQVKKICCALYYGQCFYFGKVT